MNKTIAITSQNKKRITKHAGKCDFLYIYTINDKEILSVETLELKENEKLHSIFHGLSDISESPIFKYDILLTGSIGPGAVAKLKNKGVLAYSVNERDPKTAVEKFIAGTLEVFTHNPKHSCNH